MANLNSPAYEAAISAHNDAQEKFFPIRNGYHVGKVSHADFLAARFAYAEATKVFDAAYFAECERAEIAETTESTIIDDGAQLALAI